MVAEVETTTEVVVGELVVHDHSVTVVNAAFCATFDDAEIVEIREIEAA